MYVHTDRLWQTDRQAGRQTDATDTCTYRSYRHTECLLGYVKDVQDVLVLAWMDLRILGKQVHELGVQSARYNGKLAGPSGWPIQISLLWWPSFVELGQSQSAQFPCDFEESQLDRQTVCYNGVCTHTHKGPMYGSGVRLERRKVDRLERRKVDRLERWKVT